MFQLKSLSVSALFQPLKASFCWYAHKQKSFHLQIFIFLSYIHMPLIFQVLYNYRLCHYISF